MAGVCINMYAFLPCRGSMEGPGDRFLSSQYTQICKHTHTHVLTKTHADLCRRMNSRRRGQVDSHKVMKWNDGPPGRVGKKKKKILRKNEGRFGLARKLKPLQANWVQVLLKGESTPINLAPARRSSTVVCGGEVVWEHPLTGGVGGSGDSKQQTTGRGDASNLHKTCTYI